MKLPAYLLFILLFVKLSVQQNDCVFNGCDCGDLSDDTPSGTIYCNDKTDFPKRNEDYTRKVFEALDVSGNSELEEIPDGRFEGLSFDELRMEKNHIYKIGQDAFKGAVKIEMLDLSENCLGCAHGDKKEATVEETSTEVLPTTDLISPLVFDPIRGSLRELRLHKNRLRQLTAADLSRLFENLVHLQYLDLEANSLKTAPNLNNLHKLISLNLKDNKISTLSTAKDSSSQHLLPSKLKDLNLEKNLLGSIEAHWFEHLTDLVKLNLKRNLISAIAENAFINLRKLEELDLSANYIKHIPSRVFLTLGSLKHLDLSEQKNAIELIGDFAFDRELNKNSANQYNKLTVKLNSNKISKISKKAFCARNSQRNAYINHVELSGNVDLKEADPCIFRQLNLDDDSKIQSMDEKNRVKLKLPELSCSCDVTYLASVFNLFEVDCKNENNNPVKMHKFICLTYDDYVTKKLDSCKSDEYDCSSGKQTPAPEVPVVVKPDDNKPDEKKEQAGPNDKGKDIITTIAPKRVSFAIKPSFNMLTIFVGSLIAFILIK